MPDLTAIRNELAVALNTIGQLNAHPITPGTVQTPCAIVEPSRVDWQTAMQRGHEAWELTIRVLLGTASVESAQRARDEFFGGAKDIKDAVEGHIPLRDGTAADDVMVTEARSFDAWQLAGIEYLGVEFIVNVYA